MFKSQNVLKSQNFKSQNGLNLKFQNELNLKFQKPNSQIPHIPKFQNSKILKIYTL